MFRFLNFYVVFENTVCGSKKMTANVNLLIVVTKNLCGAVENVVTGSLRYARNLQGYAWLTACGFGVGIWLPDLRSLRTAKCINVSV